MIRPLSLAITLTALTLPLSAQVLAGVGRTTLGPLPVQTTVNSNGVLGCAFLNGEIFVSARGNNGGTAAPHTLYVLDMTGALLRSYTQHSSTAGSAWGYRDGATDGASLIFGSEGGLVVFDANHNPVNQLLTQNGPRPITTPLFTTATALCRAIGYDPRGNGGNGSFFIGNFGTAIWEIDFTGAILNTFPILGTPNNWSSYGIALDPSGQTLWVNSVPATSTTVLGDIMEFSIDRTTPALVPTGRKFKQSFFGTQAAQGGLDIAWGLDGRGCGYDLIEIHQGTPDSLTAHRVDMWAGVSSQNDHLLVTGVDGGARNGLAKSVSVTGNTSLEFELLAPLGTQFVMFLNFGALVPRPVGPILGFRAFWEFRLLTAFTTPAGFSLDVAFAALGSTTPLVLSTPVLAPIAGMDMNAQAVSIDLSLGTNPCGLGLPLQVTNVVKTTITP